MSDDQVEDEEHVGPRSSDDVAAARRSMDEARRLIRWPSRRAEAGDEPLDPAFIAYEMELAEHRSTTERAHQAELAARDAAIAHMRYEVDDLRRRLSRAEAEAERLRVALQVLTGRPVPEQAVAEDDVRSTGEDDRPHSQ